MRSVRYLTLAFLALTPALAAAQSVDSLFVEVDGVRYLADEVRIEVRFEGGTDVGPLPLVIVASGPTGDFPDALPDEGCNPYTAESAAAVVGNIAFVMRGTCSFGTKVQYASAAGAVTVVIYNDEPDDGEPPPLEIPLSCPPEKGCTVPAAFLFYDSGQAILAALADGPTDATIIPTPFVPPASAVLGTGTVETRVYGDGFIGSDPRFIFGGGFTFEGVNGLFVSSVLVGVEGTVVTNPYDGVSEWTALAPPATVTPPFDSPFEDFDQAVVATFASEDLGLAVTERAYARQGDAFIVFDLAIENTSGADLANVYIGIFADWDTGDTSVDDTGGVNEALNLVYVFDPVEISPYFGVVALGVDELSGYSTDATTADDAQLFAALTTEIAPGAAPAERSTVTGLGPFNIAAGATETVLFAFVAGENEADLFANALLAHDAVAVAAEETTPEGTFLLDAAYPNPFAARTTVGFTLPVAQDVRLVVYDVLGREVAVLVDGVRQAGAQAVAFEAAGLPSGTYLVRLEAGSVWLTQRLTLVR